MSLQAKKDFILQLINNNINSIDDLKKETNYSYPDLMQAIKKLILEKKIVKANSYPLVFYVVKNSEELKELNSLLVETCPITR